MDDTFPKEKTLGKPNTFGKPKLLDRAPTMGSAKSKAAHMTRRKDDGLSHSQVGKEFGVSKSTSHRTITKALTDD